MPRKKDPVTAVIDYFETAEPTAAKTVLSIVTEIVRRRIAAKINPTAKPQPAPMQPRPPRAARPTVAGPGPAPATVGE